MVQDSAASSNKKEFIFLSHNPEIFFRFRLIPFRSPLLRESRLLSFPPATKMFQFTGLSLTYL